MTWQRLVPMLVIGIIVPATVFLTQSDGKDNDEWDRKILDAYMGIPEIAAEIDGLRSQGFVDGGARSMLVSGNCGVAGCYSEHLVVHLFSKSATNPQSRSILARVHGGPRGEIGRVERVELRQMREPPVREGDPGADRKFRAVTKDAAPRPETPDQPPEPNP